MCTYPTNCDGLWGEERRRCVTGRFFETLSCQTVCTDCHGAIAYSRQTGSWGHAFNHDRQARASRDAQGRCARIAPELNELNAITAMPPAT